MQRVDRIEPRLLDADRAVEAPSKRTIRGEVTGDATENRRHLRGDVAAQESERLRKRHRNLSKRHLRKSGGQRDCGPRRFALHAIPEFAKAIEAPAGFIAGDDGGVDGADGGADHPVRFDTGFVKRLIDAALVGAERAAALEDQNHLAGQNRC